MKFIEGIVSAIQGNTKEKLNDPLIGSFIASFIVCNWQHVLVLTFGNAKIETRITDFVNAMKPVGDGLDWFWSFSGIYLLPLAMALGYVIVMPWVSIGIAKLVKPAAVGKHGAAVDLEIEQAEKQQELNKKKLLSDPTKEFLPKLVEQEIKQAALATEKLKAETDKANDEAEKAKAEKEKAEADKLAAVAAKEAEEAKVKNEKERGATQSAIEKNKLKVSAAETKAMMQANAYTASFNFVRMLSDSLAEDEIVLTVHSLNEIISAIFGYANFDELLTDKAFNNKELSKLKYVVWDPMYLGARFEEILSSDPISPEIFDSEDLPEQLGSIFEDLPYKFESAERIAENVYEELEANPYDLINYEGVSGAIAETDTTIEEMEFHGHEYEFVNDELVITASGHGSGSHRKADIPGQGINFTVKARLPVFLGKFGLANYELEVSASPERFDDDWEDEEKEIAVL